MTRVLNAIAALTLWTAATFATTAAVAAMVNMVTLPPVVITAACSAVVYGVSVAVALRSSRD